MNDRIRIADLRSRAEIYAQNVPIPQAALTAILDAIEAAATIAAVHQSGRLRETLARFDFDDIKLDLQSVDLTDHIDAVHTEGTDTIDVSEAVDVNTPEGQAAIEAAEEDE